MKRETLKPLIQIVIAIVCLYILYFAFFKLDKLVRKELENDDIKAKWYYYSYITNTSPDFIEITKDGESTIIYKAEDVVTRSEERRVGKEYISRCLLCQ